MDEELKLFFFFYFPLRMGEIEKYVYIINQCLHMKSLITPNIIEKAEREGYKYQPILAMVIGARKFKFPVPRIEPEPGLILSDTTFIDITSELEGIIKNVHGDNWKGLIKLLKMIYDLEYDRS